MKVLLFGATGMVGQGVLRECLLDPGIESVQTIGRTATGISDAKLLEIVHPDMWNFEAIKSDLSSFDACFFCLGISSVGIKEDEYRRITYGITLAAATLLSRLNPEMTFVYVSGRGTDSSERGRSSWARVKGETENALLRLPFRSAYMFRPGLIQALHNARSKTPLYRLLYTLTSPVIPLLRSMFPDYVLTTEQVGRAMVAAARQGAAKSILESKDIRELASSLLRCPAGK